MQLSTGSDHLKSFYNQAKPVVMADFHHTQVFEGESLAQELNTFVYLIIGIIGEFYYIINSFAEWVIQYYYYICYSSTWHPLVPLAVF